MKIIVGISNFSFESQRFSSFVDIQNEFTKLKALQGKFNQLGVSLSIATDILKDRYFGHSIETQFNNFSYGNDKSAVIAFRMKLERGYFSGFDKSYNSEELKCLASRPDEDNHLCCTLYAPKVLISGLSSIKSINDFDSFYETILSCYPINEDSYYQRAISHFNNIIYHSNCGETLKKINDGGINKFSITITQCLKALNQHQAQMKIPEDLSTIAALAGCKCTTQGGKGKDDMKFYFPEVSETNKINCEYHLKPHKSNDPGDSSYYHKRIYFTFSYIDGKYRTLVASIGPHL
ncbi:hypothetical protein ACPV36_16760 [Photobacterium damselae]|uniref:hypothetical protein n=1 Tax=Photobacterium damselae TaxID=38293 RepID=UPI0040678DF9